ncbi:hypothetical protein OBBRIDRAFT_421965 [Obba rivulosa]|uniref:Uncharacterized protein n=1 Tax=Obba rivulosa TaxID=1052685 RepID=A0A8E2B0Q1_9APHY|nr:hypothetical protein OBBRIDRAFT_421965 [Obba rivulosa]
MHKPLLDTTASTSGDGFHCLPPMSRPMGASSAPRLHRTFFEASLITVTRSHSRKHPCTLRALGSLSHRNNGIALGLLALFKLQEQDDYTQPTDSGHLIVAKSFANSCHFFRRAAHSNACNCLHQYLSLCVATRIWSCNTSMITQIDSCCNVAICVRSFKYTELRTAPVNGSASSWEVLLWSPRGDPAKL